MNKNKKKALAVLLGLISMGKNNGAQYVSAKGNNYYEYFKWGGISTAGAAAVALPLALYFGLMKNSGKNNNDKDMSKKLKQIVNNPFRKIIPTYNWNSGNCFFLSSLYTLYGPENDSMYEKILKINSKDLATKIHLWCLDEERAKQECKDYDLLSDDDRENQAKGFIELCKIFVRQKKFDSSKGVFNIIPKGFQYVENIEIEFEKLVCGGVLLDRSQSAGPYKEVISKFASEISPLCYASGDKSIFFEWSAGEAHKGKVDVNTNNIKIRVPFTRKYEIGHDGKVIGEFTNEFVKMDKNGKITVNGKNYYLASISLGEGHIICLQPKFKIDENENIKINALCELHCIGSPNLDVVYECTDIDDVFEVFKDRGYYFRFAPEEAIRNHQDYYCYNG